MKESASIAVIETLFVSAVLSLSLKFLQFTKANTRPDPVQCKQWIEVTYSSENRVEDNSECSLRGK